MKLFGLCTLAAFVASISCLASWATHAADVTLSGSAFYRERIALPDHAALVVELIDLSRPETVLGETRVEPSGQVPIAFGLVVDAGKFAAGQAYALKARIEVDGAAWFASKEPLPVNQAKAGEPVSLLLLRVDNKAATDAAGASLVGTTWRVMVLDGKGADPGVTSTLAFDTNGAVNGNGGCNTFRGDVTINGSSMKFGQLASTMMACEEAKSKQEAVFHAALSRTVSYALESGELTLLDAAGSMVARLAAP